MSIIYYRIPGLATATNDEPAQPPLSPPFLPVSKAVYLTELVGLAQATPESKIAYDLVLKVSRSKHRTNPVLLDGATLDNGKSYAIFLPDVPDFGYTKVIFKLNGATITTELGAPWDFKGTAGGGDANLLVASTGTYTVDAVVTYPGGTFTVTAAVEVN